MEVSDEYSVYKALNELKQCKIVKLRRLVVRDQDWTPMQLDLLKKALITTRSVTAIEVQANHPKLFQEYLCPALVDHPTINSFSLHREAVPDKCHDNDSLASLIQRGKWRELTIDRLIDGVLLSLILSAVGHSKTITTLDLSCCPLEQKHLDLLSDVLRCTTNQTIMSLFIDVANDAALSDFSQAISEHKALTSFGIMGPIDESDNWTPLSRALKANESITSIELHPEIPEEGAGDLVELIQNNRIKVLDGDFDEDNISSICAALLANTSVTSLDLGCVTEANCDLLSEVLKVHPALTQLHLLSGCRMGDELSLISAALAHNTVLADLALRDQALTETGFESLREALTVNTTLRHLTLHNNALEETHWTCVGEILQHNSSLKSLSVDSPLPGSRSWWGRLPQALVDGLRTNTSVTHLILPGGQSWAERELWAALQKNTTVRHVRVTGSLPCNAFDTLVPLFMNGNLHVESIDVTACQRHMTALDMHRVNALGFERKCSRRRAVTDLIVALFSIARRPESWALFPREIWLAIVSHIDCASYLDVAATAAAVFSDTTLRKMIDFDADVLDPVSYCHFD